MGDQQAETTRDGKVKAVADMVKYDNVGDSAPTKTAQGQPDVDASLLSQGHDQTNDETETRELTELEKYWKAVNENPTDFTGWTYLLQFVEQEVWLQLVTENSKIWHYFVVGGGGGGALLQTQGIVHIANLTFSPVEGGGGGAFSSHLTLAAASVDSNWN